MKNLNFYYNPLDLSVIYTTSKKHPETIKFFGAERKVEYISKSELQKIRNGHGKSSYKK